MTDRDRLRALVDGGGPILGGRFEDLPFPAASGAAPLHFEDTSFLRVDFTRAELEGALFDRCRLIDCCFERARLDEARFLHTRLHDADANGGCSFRHAQLDGARFEHCELALADFSSVQAWNLVLSHCGAQGADFEQASFSRHPSRNLTLTAFTADRCNLSFAQFQRVHLAGACLAGSRLREALLDDVDLTDADLSSCDLTAIQARRLVLRGADLRDAAFTDLDPRTIDLTGARIRPWQQQALMAAMGIIVDG
ncbi:MAG TPA: pentapeptide repeat-containing protein [Pseudomonadales bacterium]|nr:pentapeptide repeat-containing protein [Pseudomonadales bacterium]